LEGVVIWDMSTSVWDVINFAAFESKIKWIDQGLFVRGGSIDVGHKSAYDFVFWDFPGNQWV